MDHKANRETIRSIRNNRDIGQKDALSQATAFIDKRLKRQQATVSEKEDLKANYMYTTKLINIAEALYRAIVENTIDDREMSSAIEKLYSAQLYN